MRLRAWNGWMGSLPIHIHGYNNVHDVIVYTVIKDTQSKNVGSHAIVFKRLCFYPFTLKHNPRVYKLKRGLQRFQKSIFEGGKRWNSVKDRYNRSKSYAF